MWKGGSGYGLKGSTPTVKTTDFDRTISMRTGSVGGKGFTPAGSLIGHVKQIGYRGQDPENAAPPKGHVFRMHMAWNKHGAKKGMA
jgi:hypothetical protein